MVTLQERGIFTPFELLTDALKAREAQRVAREEIAAKRAIAAAANRADLAKARLAAQVSMQTIAADREKSAAQDRLRQSLGEAASTPEATTPSEALREQTQQTLMRSDIKDLESGDPEKLRGYQLTKDGIFFTPPEAPKAEKLPEGLQTLMGRAQMAGLAPGTPEFQQFMATGGKQEAAPKLGQAALREQLGTPDKGYEWRMDETGEYTQAPKPGGIVEREQRAKEQALVDTSEKGFTQGLNWANDLGTLEVGFQNKVGGIQGGVAQTLGNIPGIRGATTINPLAMINSLFMI
jgi:hypothetical protein